MELTKTLRTADNFPVQSTTHTIFTVKIEKIGCWNVKSLGNPTKFSIKLANVIGTMQNKNIALLAIPETQWVGRGILEIDDTTVLYSGLDEKKDGNQRGVAIALRGEWKAAWKREGTHFMISERAMKIQLKMRNSYTTVSAVCFH